MDTAPSRDPPAPARPSKRSQSTTQIHAGLVNAGLIHLELYYRILWFCGRSQLRWFLVILSYLAVGLAPSRDPPAPARPSKRSQSTTQIQAGLVNAGLIHLELYYRILWFCGRSQLRWFLVILSYLAVGLAPSRDPPAPARPSKRSQSTTQIQAGLVNAGLIHLELYYRILWFCGRSQLRWFLVILSYLAVGLAPSRDPPAPPGRPSGAKVPLKFMPG